MLFTTGKRLMIFNGVIFSKAGLTNAENFVPHKKETTKTMLFRAWVALQVEENNYGFVCYKKDKFDG